MGAVSKSLCVWCLRLFCVVRDRSSGRCNFVRNYAIIRANNCPAQIKRKKRIYPEISFSEIFLTAMINDFSKTSITNSIESAIENVQIKLKNESIFYAGEYLQGKVLVTLTRPITVKSVAINILGKAQVKWIKRAGTVQCRLIYPPPPPRIAMTVLKKWTF